MHFHALTTPRYHVHTPSTSRAQNYKHQISKKEENNEEDS